MTADTRRETDSLGELSVPAAAYWGAQTARSLASSVAAPSFTLPRPPILTSMLAAIAPASLAVARPSARPPALERAGEDTRSSRRAPPRSGGVDAAQRGAR